MPKASDSSDPTNTTEEGHEHRAARRNTVLREGVIILSEPNASSDCLILNLSDTGARIRLIEPGAFPDTCQLRLDSGVARHCKVVWRRGLEAGIEFTNAPVVEKEEASADRRKWRRDRSLRKGLVVFEGAFTTMECAVMDVSEGGARIRPVDALTCPDVFQLKIAFGPSRPCKVVRRFGPELAVQFLDRGPEHDE